MENKWYKISFNHNQVSLHTSFKLELTMIMLPKLRHDTSLNNSIKTYESNENRDINTHYCFPSDIYDICKELIIKYNGSSFSIDQLDNKIVLKDYKFVEE